MEYKITITPSAAKDLRDIQDFYMSNSSEQTAEKVLDSILSSIEKLSDFPSLGYTLTFDDYIREMDYRIIISGNYGSIYRVIKDTIYIYHIVNTKMDYKKLFT